MTNSNDTQRYVHLTDHRISDVKTFQSILLKDPLTGTGPVTCLTSELLSILTSQLNRLHEVSRVWGEDASNTVVGLVVSGRPFLCRCKYTGPGGGTTLGLWLSKIYHRYSSHNT